MSTFSQGAGSLSGVERTNAEPLLVKRSRLLLIAIGTFAIACTGTTNYRTASRGVAVLPIAESTFQVGVKADESVMDQFLMRRCAEVALEHGSRYFSLGNKYHAEGKVWTASTGFFGGKPPEGKVTIKLLDHDEPNALDAVTVVKETDSAAARDLSPAARATLAKLSQ